MTTPWSAWQRRRVRSKLAAIELLVLDVDGVLTDGGLWFSAEGQLQKRFDVQDGLVLRLLQQAWIELASLSDGIDDATEVRAGQLGIQYCLASIKDQPSALAVLQERLGVTANQTIYLGNDLNALAVRSQVNLLISPREGCIPLL